MVDIRGVEVEAMVSATGASATKVGDTGAEDTGAGGADMEEDITQLLL
jgi:hypothetical protein